MSAPTECFSYLENRLVVGGGAGFCLQTVVPVKGKDGITELTSVECKKVIEEGKCPRNHASPYLKEGERS